AASGCRGNPAFRRCESWCQLRDEVEDDALDGRVRALAAEPLLHAQAVPRLERGGELERVDQRGGRATELGEPAKQLGSEKAHELRVAIAQVRRARSSEVGGALVTGDALEE